jgi:alginate O-acetyltransferase complex protein AlgJ
VALIPSHRRYLGPAALALLVLIMLGSLVPDPVLGVWHPFMVAQKASFGSKVDAFVRAIRQYIGDNFGYAGTLPYLRGALEYALMTPSDPRVYFGQRMHLFYSGENAVNQSTGSVYRSDQVRHFVDVVDATRRALALTGSAVIRELRERGIATVDLKAAFETNPDRDLLYRHSDAHWRWNAALLAFNMTMNTIGHHEWSLDPATVLTPLSPVPAGDLARLLGLQDHLPDADYAVHVETPADTWTPINVFRALPAYILDLRYTLERTAQGERLLVLGDSFTREYWQPLLKHSGAARIGWMHFLGCTFDFTDVARFGPTLLIVAPTERNIACGLMNWPQGLPRDSVAASP